MKFIFNLFFLSITFYSFSQNLVRNHSFEEFYHCPKNVGEIDNCKFWFQPNYGSTDYFNSCANKFNVDVDVSVPNNFCGIKQPQDGFAYTGLFLFGKTDFDYREYLQGTLSNTLKEGKTYKIEFYIALADSSCLFSNSISVCFTDTFFSPDNYLEYALILPCENSVTICNNEGFLDKKWTKVEMNYIANGGESYFTIGLFSDNFSFKNYKKGVKNVVNKDARETNAYYYVDNVSITPLDSTLLNVGSY